MQKDYGSDTQRSAGQARHMRVGEAPGDSPEGLLIAGEEPDDSKIAVAYNRGEAPPEITIEETADSVRTVLANGVAVAVVARTDGHLTRDDVVLVERA